MAREHGIRQAILRDMRLYRAAPITGEELAKISQEPAIRHAAPGEALEQYELLRELGYIEAVPGYRGLYCRLAEKGQRQLLDDFPREPFIWGPGAV